MQRLVVPTLAIGLLAPALLAADSPTAPMISVSGEATLRVPPDEAVVRLGVRTEAAEASEAQRRASGIVAAILAALGPFELPDEAVQTSRLQLFPVYDHRSPRPAEPTEPRVIGYRATNIVSVTLADLGEIGPVVDASIDAGANQIESIDFRLRDDTAARRDALAAAVHDARQKAETIAGALDRPLGEVVEVVEGGVSAPPVVYREAAMSRMAADSGTPVATGSLNVTASVTARYRLGDG